MSDAHGATGCQASDAPSSVGVFWGPNDQPVKLSSDAMPLMPDKSSVCTQRSYRQRSQPIKLPSLAASANNIQSYEAGGTASSAQLLLGVLQAMLRSIRKDTEHFHNHALDVRGTKTLPKKYYPNGVEKEDPDYFIRERATLANQAAMDANTKWARQLHCASDDQQTYVFDRRKRDHRRARRHALMTLKIFVHARNPTILHVCRSEGDLGQPIIAEAVAIEHHLQKTNHLLRILQDEMANETRREIELVQLRRPKKKPSKQERKDMALLMKDRYEAADRIMRILEDYRIIFGVEAADYLKAAIVAAKKIA